MSTFMPMSPAEAVANGAQALDERYPGWWRHIDLETLDISHIHNCVCGQLDRVYNNANIPHWSEFAENLTGSEVHEQYGFRPKPDLGNGFRPKPDLGKRALNDEWRWVIEARLEADKIEAPKELMLA